MKSCCGGIFLIVLGTIFLAIGSVTGYYGVVSGSWPTVPGTVTSSKVVESQERDKDGDETTKYEAEVSFSYTVKDKAYTGSRISFGDYSSSFRSVAQSVVDKYPVGKPVDVHVDPADPTAEVLEGGQVGLFAWIFIGVGIFLYVVAVLVGVSGILFGRG